MAWTPSRRRLTAHSLGSLLLRVLGVALVLLVLVFAYQALRAGLALRQAEAQAHLLRQQLSDGDQFGATRSLRTIGSQSRTARTHTDNPLWDAATYLPVVGDDVAAVQVISRVLDDTSRAALPPALNLSTALGKQELRSADGRFDLDRIAGLGQQFDQMKVAADSATRRLDPLRARSLVSSLRRSTASLEEQVQSLRSLAEAGATAARVVPSMLGQGGRRTYLLVVQNNAETRATGGLPGSFSILTADQGRLSLGGQRSGLDFPVLPAPVLPLTSQEVALYGKSLGRDIRDTNLTPDFPRTASLMSAMLVKRYGERVDGVISVDPVALSGVLAAIGPIKVKGNTFSSGNVLSQLLNRPYEEFDTQTEQNAYFAAAARGIFDALLTEQVDQPSVVRRLVEAGSQRRLLVWSRHRAEQKRLAGTAIAGELPTGPAAAPQVGMYLNDATAAKIEYYLDYSAGLSSVRCSAGGTQTLSATLVLNSSAPSDVRGLSPWVTGFGKYARKGTIRLNLRLYAPAGGSVTMIRANGVPLKLATLRHHGRQVAVVGLLIKPGEQIRLMASLTGGADSRADPVLQVTPGVHTDSSGETTPSTCR